jgi:hypothetical protein
MSHKLEEYLKRERASLDVESPDEETIWEGISGEMSLRGKKEKPPAGKIGWIRIRNMAAAAIILFSLGYITKDIINIISSRNNVTLSSIDIKLGHREEQYKLLVDYRTKEVKALPAADEAIVKELYNELDRLDTIYRQSMSDLKVLGPNEKVINTIFDTYEQRIRLLELIILETNKIKINENNEKIIL